MRNSECGIRGPTVREGTESRITNPDSRTTIHEPRFTNPEPRFDRLTAGEPRKPQWPNEPISLQAQRRQRESVEFATNGG